MDTLYFTWLDNAVDIENNLEMPQFSLKGYFKRDCSQNYTAGVCSAVVVYYVVYLRLIF